ncbi:hypothetical protein ACRDU6_18220 [Mycolicibacterium sp. ELW1]|uniref:hypothetical protein n=1 Tax=Mycobacteriaceae TaxID=1762 RepID=UPI0011EE03CE|nr:hypothetical protein [Mycobacterium sp. ELW1]QEN14333.1 hypothetical protein D3H54_14770 [Mycobacterium sp. ELW1]
MTTVGAVIAAPTVASVSSPARSTSLTLLVRMLTVDRRGQQPARQQTQIRYGPRQLLLLLTYRTFAIGRYIPSHTRIKPTFSAIQLIGSICGLYQQLNCGISAACSLKQRANPF